MKDWVHEFWSVVLPYVKGRTKATGWARKALMQDMAKDYLPGFMHLGDGGKVAFLDILRD